MKRQKRLFQRDIVNHCYQRTLDGGVLFYCYSDYLVWFTIICTIARKYQVRILAMCPMPDHIHLTVIARFRKDLSDFMADYSRLFSTVHNQVCHKKGQLFQHPFGSAPKRGAKAARTNLVYVGNNPVERQLADKAEEYRWTFLAYCNSEHPFSDKLVIRDSRWPLQKAVKEVKLQFNKGKPLSYAQLQRLFRPLDRKEALQLTDFIISTYNVIDYTSAIRFFDSYEDMLMAMHSNTGSEYDLNEPFVGKSDAHYAKMIAVIKEVIQPEDIHDILSLPPKEKYELFRLLRAKTDAPSEQIAKFLHITLKRNT